MILETISSSITALTALGPAERIAAAGAFFLYVCALAGIRWIGRPRRRPDRAEEQQDLADAA